MVYRKARRMRKLAAMGAAAFCTVALTACPRPVRAPETAPTPAALPGPSDLRGAAPYQLDADASEVHILVYRAGPLARLGHNHVMTPRTLTGRAWLHEDFTRSGFELSFPVADLVVDDPAARIAAGADFDSEITQADRQATQANMLRSNVLDAQHHPVITLRSVRVSGSKEDAQLTTLVTIRDASREIVIPAKLTVQNDRITASGAFDVLQTQFGIEPFSVALGALAVQDRLHVRFRVSAVRLE
ncbi:MAG TPA: YceI family protein [Steroidobacter sp.]|jgi:polyisoprenoid-binding protein YceI|nr:YceI family protein [Steroidobacteraceae bacterium]HLS79875.1 YceI family protein [Steroidobacter sp.]